MTIFEEFAQYIRESVKKPPKAKTVKKVLILGGGVFLVGYLVEENYRRFYLPIKTENEAKKLLFERRDSFNTKW